MTKSELMKYIESLHRKPGEYTESELIEIGIKHQELSIRSEKDWPALALQLGVGKSGEQFRKWILNKRYSKGLVAKNPKILDDKTIDEVTARDVSNSLEEQKAELYKVRTQVRDTYNAYRGHLRDDARLTTFKEEFKASLKELNALPKVESAKINKTLPTSEMVLGFSDLHLGQQFENSYNAYSYDIAVKRVNKLVSDVVHYCRLHNVVRLNFLNLGDLCSGLIHLSLRLEQNLSIIEQIQQAAELTAEVLNQLQAAAPEVIYRSVTDNHSRAIANKDENIEKENFNKLIDWFLEERLKGTKIKFAHDNIDDGIGMFRLMNGKLMLFSHGHQDRKSTIFQDMTGLIREYPDYIFMAHYHNAAEHTFQNCKVFINGSIIGTDGYAYSRRLFGEPEQKALIFTENNIVNIDINLN